MASKTKKCKVCGQDIAKSAKVCPGCGAKNSKPIFLRVWFIILVIVIVAAVAMMGGEDETDISNVKYTAYRVDELIAELNTNAMAAEEEYNEAYVEVTGRLDVIDSDGSYISIYSIDDEWDWTGVMCYIKNEEQKEAVKKLAEGDIVTLKGQITAVGELLGYELDIIEFVEE